MTLSSVVRSEYLETQDQFLRNFLVGEMRSFHYILVLVFVISTIKIFKKYIYCIKQKSE